MRRTSLMAAFAGLGALLLSAGTALAGPTLVSGTGTFADNGPANNGLNFTGITNNSELSNLSLNVGQSVSLNDFLTITASDTAGSWFGTAGADSIAETFNFTLPSSASGILPGTGKDTAFTDFFGQVDFTSGKISWENPLTLNFKDGAQLQIDLSSTHFLSFSANATANVDAKLTLTKAPNAVPAPEPGSLALLATGLLGLTMVAQRRRRVF